MPRSWAIRSAPRNWFGMSRSQPGARGVPVSGGMFAPRGTRDIISTPQAMPVSMTPAWIRPATRRIDCCAEEHRASIGGPAVWWGRPAGGGWPAWRPGGARAVRGAAGGGGGGPRGGRARAARRAAPPPGRRPAPADDLLDLVGVLAAEPGALEDGEVRRGEGLLR